MVPFAEKIDGAKKYVVSRTLDRVDWHAELVRGDLEKAIQQLKGEPGNGLFVGALQLMVQKLEREVSSDEMAAVARQVGRLGTLIDRLLDVACITSGSLVLSRRASTSAKSLPRSSSAASR